MITEDALDMILDALVSKHNRKRDIALIKANDEIRAIEREDVAYFDGAFDAIKAVKERMTAEAE